MSYILDALRKSDQLRRRGAAPTLMLGMAAATAPKPRANLYYGVLALALLGAGIAIGWLRPWQPAPVVQAPAAIAAQAPAAAQARLPAPQRDRPAVPQPERTTRKNAQTAAPDVRPGPAPLPAPAKPQGSASAKPARQTAPSKSAAGAPKQAAAPARRPDSEAAGTTAPGPVIAMKDLPLAIQHELPPMSISVHAYSDKTGERLVGINNRLLHEGAEVAPGLKLEQITPDGMILSYKGYSFRRGVH
ncbi:MAG: general secretion pathway protein GspB [Pseudomonadota bacterium]